mmetsp:Transcript_44692/g.37582  ORF Transcript_44692/g.37582 Transcript_44692/m.37582 type:complete len:246 (+) Transcript_44692:1512-2249(+)
MEALRLFLERIRIQQQIVLDNKIKEQKERNFRMKQEEERKKLIKEEEEKAEKERQAQEQFLIDENKRKDDIIAAKDAAHKKILEEQKLKAEKQRQIEININIQLTLQLAANKLQQEIYIKKLNDDMCKFIVSSVTKSLRPYLNCKGYYLDLEWCNEANTLLRDGETVPLIKVLESNKCTDTEVDLITNHQKMIDLVKPINPFTLAKEFGEYFCTLIPDRVKDAVKEIIGDENMTLQLIYNKLKEV